MGLKPRIQSVDWGMKRAMGLLTREQIGQRLRALREERALSIEELAAEAKIPAESLAEFEGGLAAIPSQELVALANLLGIRPNSLLRDDEDAKPLFRVGSDASAGDEALVDAERVIDDFFALEALTRR